MRKYYALVDCNNFYASCERVFNPKLKNKPVAILSNNDGCIVAMSQEAKTLGIVIGTPYFKARKLIDEYKGAVFSSNYELYGDMSKRVTTVLRNFSASLEIYSIDEAFIEIPSSQYNNLEGYCSAIVKTIYKWTGIPVKVGVASTKTLAKLATELVKIENRNEGFKILTDEDEIESVLKKTPVNKIWGIGSKLSKRLNTLGIFYAKQLTEKDEAFLRRYFSVMMARTSMELKEILCFEVDDLTQPQKNLCYSRSFGTPVTDFESMKQSIIYYASSAAEKLRKNKQKAQSITVYLTTNYFNKKDKQYSNTKTLTFPSPCNNSMQITAFAVKAIKSIYLDGYKYKKSGVLFNDLIPEDIEQQNLFTKINPKDSKLSAAIDEINNKLGKGSIKFLGEGLNPNWQMKREMQSSKYTSNWDELLKIK